jgi:hypothetical protein
MLVEHLLCYVSRTVFGWNNPIATTGVGLAMKLHAADRGQMPYGALMT